MGVKRESFIFYRSFFEAISSLDADTKIQCYDALLKYAFEGEETELEGVPKAIFALIKPQLDANNERYENGKKGAGYGKLGGRPKKNPIGDNNKNPIGVMDENPTKTPNDNVNENVNDNVNDNENEKEKHIKGSAPFSDNETLNEAFQDFQKMRKSIKKPLTDRAIGRLRNKLNNLSEDPETQAAILNQSTDHCWQDVYELKDDYRQQSPRKPTQSEEFYDPDLENLTSEELAQMEADVNARRCSKSEWMNLWRRRKNGFV